jgi:uncharacterized protein (DUF433 family)
MLHHRRGVLQRVGRYPGSRRLRPSHLIDSWRAQRSPPRARARRSHAVYRTRRGIRCIRSIMGRHATSRRFRSARQRQVNGFVASWQPRRLIGRAACIVINLSSTAHDISRAHRRDPAICAGQPVIRGTRVLVRVILGYLAHDEPTTKILKEFPSLTEEDVRAVIAFAAASAAEDLPAPTPIPPDMKVA